MQQGRTDRLAPQQPFVLATQRHGHLRENAGAVRRLCHLIQDQPARLVKAGAALDQIVSKAAFQPEPPGKRVDGANPLAFRFSCPGDQGIGIGGERKNDID
jgi:hypothetical protein